MRKFLVLIILFGSINLLNAQSEWQKRLTEMQSELQDKIQSKIKKNSKNFAWSENDRAKFAGDMEKMQADLSRELSNMKADLEKDFPEYRDVLVACIAESYTGVVKSLETDLNREVYSINQFDDDLFDKLADIKGVEVVYISKALLGLMPKMTMSGVNIGSVAAKLDGLQIFTAEGGGALKTLKSESGKLVKKGKYETVMFVKDDDSKTVFYLKKMDNRQSELLMVTEEPSEISVIRLMGNFTIKDIQSLTKDQTNKK